MISKFQVSFKVPKREQYSVHLSTTKADFLTYKSREYRTLEENQFLFKTTYFFKVPGQEKHTTLKSKKLNFTRQNGLFQKKYWKTLNFEKKYRQSSNMHL